MKNSRETLVAKYVSSLEMDGKLSDPSWKITPSYNLSLPGDLVLSEAGTVRVLWNEEHLYVGAQFEDSDVVAEGKADQTHLYQFGDLLEVFLKPENETYYWELYGAPNNLKTSFFFPGRGRLFLPSSAEYHMDLKLKTHVEGTLNNWRDKDIGWSAELDIPVSALTEFGVRFDNSANWTILISRYNYSRYLPQKECSSFPKLSAVNFHRTEEYARLSIEK